MKKLLIVLTIAFIAIYLISFFYVMVCFAAIIEGTMESEFMTKFILALIVVLLGSPFAIKIGDELDKN